MIATPVSPVRLVNMTRPLQRLRLRLVNLTWPLQRLRLRLQRLKKQNCKPPKPRTPAEMSWSPAMSLLRASLISNSVLSDVFYQKKPRQTETKPKRIIGHPM